MYRQHKAVKGTLKGITPYRAESIEATLSRMLSNKEPIGSVREPIYTDRKEGVLPDYDIRTDKFEYLVEGKDAIAKTQRAKRDNIGKATEDLEKKNEELKTEQKKGDSSETK